MRQPKLSHGPLWMPLLLVGAILLASVPMLAGITLTALAPWLGHLSQPPMMALLHVLWMYPVL